MTGLALAADTGRLLLAAVAETGGITLVTWESSLARRRRADKGELERQDYIICMYCITETLFLSDITWTPLDNLLIE